MLGFARVGESAVIQRNIKTFLEIRMYVTYFKLHSPQLSVSYYRYWCKKRTHILFCLCQLYFMV